MRTALRVALAVALAMPYAAVALAADTAPDQPAMPKPLSDPKPVTTTVIKRCPEGYELVTRANGRRGCAKDVLPANE